MQSFSKRYSNKSIRSIGENNPNVFITDELRNRLLYEIRYIVETKTLENFIIVLDYPATANKYYFNDDNLKNFSLAELGYDLTEFINCKTLEINPSVAINDYKIFDLIEILIIFSVENQREKIVKRFNDIFSDESSIFFIYEDKITKKETSNIKSLLPLINDDILKNKLIEFYNINETTSDYKILSRISADLVQRLFSSEEKQKKTRAYAEQLCSLIAKQWTMKNRASELSVMINESVLLAKKFNSKIEDIRHTDKSTIPVGSPSIYKMITMNNMAIIELTLLSCPEKYFGQMKAMNIKKNYLNKYHVDPNAEWTHSKNNEKYNEINVEDIPF
ncbi:MAG: hypothetical protein WCW27_03160 [Patescibacteria group bacterium]|jgi:hypothetical protein